VQTDAGVAEEVAHALVGLVHGADGVVELLADGALDPVDPLLDRSADRRRHRVEPHLVAVEAVVQVVEALVQAPEAVVEPVHPARHALQPPGHAVEPPVELGDRLGDLVGYRLDGMTAAIAASWASSLATVSSRRSARTLTSVRSGSSVIRLRIVPRASSAARRAWISSSESKICCCSLSRISAARMSMPRMRSNDSVESLLMAAGSFL
jgi:hypothetical protein